MCSPSKRANMGSYPIACKKVNAITCTRKGAWVYDTLLNSELTSFWKNKEWIIKKKLGSLKTTKGDPLHLDGTLFSHDRLSKMRVVWSLLFDRVGVINHKKIFLTLVDQIFFDGGKRLNLKKYTHYKIEKGSLKRSSEMRWSLCNEYFNYCIIFDHFERVQRSRKGWTD